MQQPDIPVAARGSLNDWPVPLAAEMLKRLRRCLQVRCRPASLEIRCMLHELTIERWVRRALGNTSRKGRCGTPQSTRARGASPTTTWQAWRIRVLVALLLAAVPCSVASAADLKGMWLVEGGGAAVEMFDCADRLCARIVWLEYPRDETGQRKIDRMNPNEALRQRPLCGLTVLTGLRLAEADRWEAGAFYNPQTGLTYGFAMKVESADVLVARAYIAIPVFGETQVLRRVPALPADGRCLPSH
jgi:uncharacterized protein (DUF2147 family)